MICLNTPVIASLDSGPAFSAESLDRICASRSGRWAGPPALSAPIACACDARAFSFSRISRSSESIASRWRASSASRSSPCAGITPRPPCTSREGNAASVGLAQSRADATFGPRLRPARSFGLVVALDDALEARELLAVAEIDQRDALRRAAHFADRFDRHAHPH